MVGRGKFAKPSKTLASLLRLVVVCMYCGIAFFHLVYLLRHHAPFHKNLINSSSIFTNGFQNNYEEHIENAVHFGRLLCLWLVVDW